VRDEDKSKEQLMAELREAHGQLAELRNLAVGIAHELNNPISIILSRIELMLLEAEDQPVASDSRADLQVLHRHSQRLSQITQGLLSFGRERQRTREPIDLNEVVEGTLLLAGERLGHAGIQVLKILDARLPRILGDMTALEQVLINLVLNARDAMPTGGTLRIETSLAPAQPAAIRLVVSDMGSGMLPEVLAKLGRSFFTTKPQGSGLGLSVSFTIIREHGGTVDVRSEPGHGTVFTVVFPSFADRASSRPESGDPAA
jgi:signal transduction histidine kinase